MDRDGTTATELKQRFPVGDVDIEAARGLLRDAKQGVGTPKTPPVPGIPPSPGAPRRAKENASEDKGTEEPGKAGPCVLSGIPVEASS